MDAANRTSLYRAFFTPTRGYGTTTHRIRLSPLTSCIVASSTLFVLLTPTSLPLPPIAKPRIAYAARSKPSPPRQTTSPFEPDARPQVPHADVVLVHRTRHRRRVPSHTATRVALDVALSTHATRCRARRGLIGAPPPRPAFGTTGRRGRRRRPRAPRRSSRRARPPREVGAPCAPAPRAAAAAVARRSETEEAERAGPRRDGHGDWRHQSPGVGARAAAVTAAASSIPGATRLPSSFPASPPGLPFAPPASPGRRIERAVRQQHAQPLEVLRRSRLRVCCRRCVRA